jgi:hypothetical protein
MLCARRLCTRLRCACGRTARMAAGPTAALHATFRRHARETA